MAVVLPFKGILYNPAKVDRLSDVITPPFDVISSQEQDRFYERSPFNMIRLILGKPTRYDTRTSNPHSRAASDLAKWLTDGILVRDHAAAFYLTALDFRADGAAYRRYGLISLVKLSSYDGGVILPHERTFTNVKSERLALMKACHANFSPIFSMVPDDDGSLLNNMRQWSEKNEPDIAFTAADECRHQLWRIVDAQMVQVLSDALRPKKLYIADGHHRYETALNYCAWMHETHPGIASDHPANFVMMYLSSMADPGLIIRPAHRLLREIPPADLDLLLQKAQELFKIEAVSFQEDERDAALQRFVDAMHDHDDRILIGMFIKGRRLFYRLTMNDNVSVDDIFGSELSGPLRRLDVMVLTRLLFAEYLGFDKSRLDNETLIAYTTDAHTAVARVMNEDFNVCFLLNPTSVQQVREVADSGLVMPRKATYFYPKVTTGLVINPLWP